MGAVPAHTGFWTYGCWGLLKVISQGHQEKNQRRADGILPSQLDVCDLIRTAGEFFIYFSAGKHWRKLFFSVLPKYFFDSFWVFIENENIKCCCLKTKRKSLSDDNNTNVWIFLLKQEFWKKAVGQAPTALCPRFSWAGKPNAVAWCPGYHVISLWFHPCCDSDAWWWLWTISTGKWVGGFQVRLRTPLLPGWLCTCRSHLEQPKVWSQLPCLPVFPETVKMGRDQWARNKCVHTAMTLEN